MRLHHRNKARVSLLVSTVILAIVQAGLAAQNSVVVWGNTSVTNVPQDVTNVAIVFPGLIYGTCLAVKRDGQVRAWGTSSTVPAQVTNVAKIVNTYSGQLYVLRRNGTVTGWSIPDNNLITNVAAMAVNVGQSTTPATLQNTGLFLPPGSSTVQSNVVALASISDSVDWLYGDGTIGSSRVAPNIKAQLTNVVFEPDSSGVVRAWLRADGTVISVLGNQTNVLGVASNISTIASGYSHVLALRHDGTVVAWGNNTYGQTNVPAGLSNVVSIVAGGYHNFALTAGGTVVAWGAGPTNLPPALTNVAAVFADGAAIVGECPPWLIEQPPDQTSWGGRSALFRVTAVGSVGLQYQWQFNGEYIAGATGSFYRIPATTLAHRGRYNVIVSNTHGAAASREALLNVFDDPTILSQPTNQTLVVGTMIVFRVTAMASQPISYQWFFNGSPISGATNSTFTLANVAMEQAGLYWVTVSDSRGSRTSIVAELFPPVIVAWGDATPSLNSSNASVSGIACDSYANYVIRPDGTVSLWDKAFATYPDLTPGLSNVVALGAGYRFLSALQQDGSVIGVGDNNYGQTSVPAGLSNVVAVAARGYNSLAIHSDGKVAAWGRNSFGQTNVPAGLSNAVGIAAGDNFSLALLSNGNVVAWGYHLFGETNVPPGLSNAVAIAAGGSHSLALRADGTIVAWGKNDYGQTNVPPGLSNVLAVAAGDSHSVALHVDGSVTAWGSGQYPSNPAVAGLSNVVAIAASGNRTLALLGRGLSAPAVQLSASDHSDAVFRVSVPTVRGKTYYLVSRDSLADPSRRLLSPTPGDGSTKRLFDYQATGSQRFYRVWQKP